MSTRTRKVVTWGQHISDLKSFQVKQIAHFDARGLKPIYGRGDHFPDHGAYHMDIWADRTGKLLARFWSYRLDVDGESYEVTGMESLVKAEGKDLDEYSVPVKLRKAYDEWILCFL